MFDKIYNKWKEEREKEVLTPVNEAFYGAMRDFLKTRTVRAKEEINPIIKKILEERLNRLRYVINNLLKIRTAKIVSYIISREEIVVDLAREEENFYKRMKQLYDIYRKDIFSPKDIAYTDVDAIVGEEDTGDSEEPIEYVAVRFLKNTEETIIGLDSKSYGPFNLEEVCILPKENAVGLVRREIAEKIDL